MVVGINLPEAGSFSEKMQRVLGSRGLFLIRLHAVVNELFSFIIGPDGAGVISGDEVG